jgi:hypothetical protein
VLPREPRLWSGTRTRAYPILIVFGVIALIVGGAILVGSVLPQVRSTTFTLPPGNYCTRLQFDVVTAGTVDVVFQADVGAVNQYVMTEAQHAAFVGGGGLSYLATDSGSSGSFSASLPAGGTYFVETCHASGYETTTQTGSHMVTINAVSTSIAGGIAGLVLGAILVGVGAWLWTKPPKPVSPPYPMYPYPPSAPYGGPAMPPGSVPPYGWPGAYPPPAAVLHTLQVRIENVSSNEEIVDVSIVGVKILTIPVPAGKTTEVSVPTHVPLQPGVAVAIRAVTQSGLQAQQSVNPDPSGRAAVWFRFGGSPPAGPSGPPQP